uniref:Uncharacterized protein n=1 Tax=Romanomermis culicivorax TaxID=13658 RepID=A0A915HW93_ROMCU
MGILVKKVSMTCLCQKWIKEVAFTSLQGQMTPIDDLGDHGKWIEQVGYNAKQLTNKIWKDTEERSTVVIL